MRLSLATENKYVRDVLCNTSLLDLPDEKWKLIEYFENYAISNYGRIKSLERNTLTFKGNQRRQPELIMKLFFAKQFNKYLNLDFFHVQCSLCSESRKHRKSIARLIYYHFIEKFDMNDRNIVISYKDGNSLHLHQSNLEKISSSEQRLRTFYNNRARNRRVDYMKPVRQYTVEGTFVANFTSIYDAEKAVGVGCESIQDVIDKKFLTAGGFRWFLPSALPKKEDFIVQKKPELSSNLFNKSLWEKLGKPLIDFDNPPSCMNLSLENLPDERWKLIPGFENRFAISNKGRVKRLSGWTSTRRKVFLEDQILSQILTVNKGKNYSLYCILQHKRKNRCVAIPRLLYCCFVEKFDLSSKKQVVINQNKPQWNIDITKLSLQPVYNVLKRRVN